MNRKTDAEIMAKMLAPAGSPEAGDQTPLGASNDSADSEEDTNRRPKVVRTEDDASDDGAAQTDPAESRRQGDNTDDNDDQHEDEDGDDQSSNTADEGDNDQASDDEDEQGDDLDALFGDDADQDRDEEGEGEAFDTSQLGEDTTFSVTVDGEEQQVTLGDLKRRYAGEGAIERRLQQATETRQKTVEDYEKSKTLVTNVLEQLGQALFRRTVPEPDAAMKAQNPQAYYEQKEMYDAETSRLQQMHGGLYTTMQKLDKLHSDARAERRREAHAELLRLMPVFKDPVKGPKAKQVIVEAAREIGYTDAMIAASEDPLMFKTMALAAKELRRQRLAKATPVQEKKRTMKKAGKNQSPQTAAKRQETRLLERARKTRNLADIEASLLQTVKTPRRR